MQEDLVWILKRIKVDSSGERNVSAACKMVKTLLVKLQFLLAISSQFIRPKAHRITENCFVADQLPI
jgi:hypothetical protein